MKRTGVGSWTLIVASSLIIGSTLTACGGGGSSSDTQSTASADTGVSAGSSSEGNNSSLVSDSSSGTAPTTATVDPSTPVVSSTGAVTLAWQPPTENTDGTPLTTLAGYNVYYGTQSQNYTASIKVSNPGLATYVVDSLPAGTYYIALTAVDATGAESDYSSEVAVQIN